MKFSSQTLEVPFLMAHVIDLKEENRVFIQNNYQIIRTQVHEELAWL